MQAKVTCVSVAVGLAAMFMTAQSLTSDRVSKSTSDPEVAKELPKVGTVLGKATSKLDEFTAQATAMSAKVAAKQQSAQLALEQEKAQYESQLKAQAEKNAKAAKENAERQRTIDNLQVGIDNMRKSANLLAKSNDVYRQTIDSLLAKMRTAASFLDDTMSVTDATKDETLKVLEPVKEVTLKSFLSSIHDGAPAKPSKLGLFQGQANVISEVWQIAESSSPEALIAELQKSMKEMTDAERDGAAVLQANFNTLIAQGEEENKKLMATMEALDAKIAAMEKENSDLIAAKEHLEATHKELQRRLQGIRIFVRKVDNETINTFKVGEAMLTQDAVALKRDTKDSAWNFKAEAEATKETTPAALELGKVAQLKAGAKTNAGKQDKANDVEGAAIPPAVVKVATRASVTEAKQHNKKGRKMALVDAGDAADETAFSSEQAGLPDGQPKSWFGFR